MNLFNKNHRFIIEHDNVIIQSGFCHHDRNYEIVPSREDYPGLRHEKKNIHSNYYPVKEAEKMVRHFKSTHRNIICLGLGLGYYLSFLQQKYSGQIIVIEPDKNLFNIALNYLDLANFPQIKFIIGFDDFEVENLLSLPANEIDFFEFRQRVEIHKDYFVLIKKRLLKRKIFSFGSRLEYEKFVNDQLKIVFIDSSYVLTKEVVSALKILGHQVRYVHIDKSDYDYSEYIKNMLNLIDNFRPDFILTINHLGFDKSGKLTELLSELKIPYASWYVDSPNVILSSYKQNISPFCNIFVWDRDYIEEVRNVGYPFVDYLPLATMPELFRPQDIPFENDVSFVGSSMVFAIHKNLKSMVHRPDLLELFEKTVVKFENLSSRKVSEAINLMEADGIEYNFDDSEQKKDFEAAVLWRATQRYRLSGIKKLAAFNPTLRGDPNWDRFLDNRFKIGREVWYYDQMPKFYNSSKINFNMTSKQMKYAVNQRVFDVPACQKFILTDYQQQLEEIFEVGKDIICFRDVEEIPDLVRFYLDNSTERIKVAMNGFKKVIANHTYEHRLRKLIRIVKANYAKL